MGTLYDLLPSSFLTLVDSESFKYTDTWTVLTGTDDSNLDPISGKKNNDPTLLSSNTPTTSHLLGITVVAPPSTLSDDLIPAFNAVDAQSEIVLEPFFPTLEKANPDFLPAEGTGDSSQWAAVKTAWGTPLMGVEKVQEYVNFWAESMGWILDEAFAAVPPKLTIDAFEQTYMASPVLQVSA